MDKAKFVQNIKSICTAKNIRPTIACKESGAGKDLINQIERQGSMPSIEKVQLLAQYLGVTVSELLGETSAVNPTPVSDLTPEDCEMLEAYHRADQRAKDMVNLALEPFREKEKSASVG